MSTEATQAGGEEPGGGFWQDPGPEFSPETAPEAPDPDAPIAGEDLGWTPEGVASFLREIQAPAFNAMLNPLLGVREVDWTHREKRLEAVAPAIAREWNKIPHVRALAGHMDRGIILSYMILEYFGPRTFDVIHERKARAGEAEREVLEHEDPAAAGFYEGREMAPEPTDPGPRVTGLPPRRR